MGPKKSDNLTRTNKQSIAGTGSLANISLGINQEAEVQQCVGKFAADFELCCREVLPTDTTVLPIFIRGHPPVWILSQSSTHQNQQVHQNNTGTHSGTPATPSIGATNTEEQLSVPGKKGSRVRVPSASQGGALIGVTSNDYDGRSFILQGVETTKTSSTSYKTFSLVRDSEYFKSKVLVDSVNGDNEPIEQITAIHIRDRHLNPLFIEVFKRVFPLQEQLHTANFSYVGLNAQTIHGLAELCQVSKSLKTLILDGNPNAAGSFHLLIDKDDAKLSCLSLRYCQITDQKLNVLAHSLGSPKRSNKKLLTLNLSNNEIGDHGAQSIATALRYNRTLISLNLSSNFITDEGAIAIALVLRSISLTMEETIMRRETLAKRYADAHPEEMRNVLNSPTPSTMSNFSRSGREGKSDSKRSNDPLKRKANLPKPSQQLTERRNRVDSDENRPPSVNRNDSKRGRNESSASRASNANTSSSINAASRRTPTNNQSSTTKETEKESTRPAVGSKVKKVTTAVNVSSKKNIAMVKEENEERQEEDQETNDSSTGKTTTAQNQQAEKENPLLEKAKFDPRDGQLKIKGNHVLMNLNLSRNDLTMKSLREFLMTIQQQAESSSVSLSSPTIPMSALLEFTGLCRLELRGINAIETSSAEYQSLRDLLVPKSPTIRFQSYRDREAKEILESATAPPVITTQPPLQPTTSEKSVSTPEKSRSGSSVKTSDRKRIDVRRNENLRRKQIEIASNRRFRQEKRSRLERSEEDSWKLFFAIGFDREIRLKDFHRQRDLFRFEELFEWLNIERRQDCRQIENYFQSLCLTDRRKTPYVFLDEIYFGSLFELTNCHRDGSLREILDEMKIIEPQ